MERGIFAVAKPVGITSAGVINRIRAVLREEAGKAARIKVGHGGTLDRAASGVLVVALGSDCKRLRNFLASDKCYEAVGKLGEATDTYDMDSGSRVIRTASWEHVEREHITRVLAGHFTGEISQIPPAYSALKCGGERASDLARKGIDFTLPPRKVTVYSVRLIKFHPPRFTIAVHCSSGTYIRSMVYDIGRHLGSAAHVSELCRTKQGQFTLSCALREQDWTFEKINNSITSF